MYTGVDNLEIMASATNYNEFLLDQVMKLTGDAQNVVDFGTGRGSFSVMLRDRGVNPTCVEPDKGLRKRLVDLEFTTYQSIDALPEGSVDLVFSLNVFEHIEDDGGVMKQVFRCIRPGGRLYLYVPAFDVLFSSMDRKVGHYRRYTKATALRLLRDAGFRVERARYADSLGFPISLLYKLIGNKRGDINTRSVMFYDRVIFPLSRLLDLFLGRFMGKNLGVTAVRPHSHLPSRLGHGHLHAREHAGSSTPSRTSQQLPATARKVA